ncbi:MAG TPA: hypothetical protein VMU42_03755 [Candidatus Sulfotelmatobacter sp.]|nr:hypothetical protein [Candidatus Sulfotelmatobacter sp.]
MKSSIKAIFLVLALAGGSLGPISPAMADNVTVAVGGGGIAFGYSDGYWDRDHHWHKWHNRAEAAKWRAANRDHYYAWKHDRDKGDGWRDSDRWWEHH